MVSWLVEWLFLPVVIFYHAVTLAMLIASIAELRRLRRTAARELAATPGVADQLPPVSVLVPAYNEARTIVRTVESLLALRYSHYEVLVINDGSTDNTLEVLRSRFALEYARSTARQEIATQRVRSVQAAPGEPRLRVIDKRNGGKADALNAGLDHARYPLILAVDADVVLAEDALTHLALPFVLDPETVATSGIIRPQNGCEIVNGRIVRTAAPAGWLARIQVVEYLRAYGVGRMFFNRLNAHLIISGAFGLFSRKLLSELGGYQTHSVGEDMELVVRIHRYLRQQERPYRIAFSAEALCLTEAPHTLGDLGKQRTRWHQGLLSTLRLHRSMCFRPKYGAVGMVAFPYFVVELFYPFLEVVGWVMLPLMAVFGVASIDDAVSAIVALTLLGSAVSLAAIAIDAGFFSFFHRPQDRIALILASYAEHLGYHQCTIYFRIRAFFRYYRHLQLRTAWQPPERAAAGPRPDSAGAGGG